MGDDRRTRAGGVAAVERGEIGAVVLLPRPDVRGAAGALDRDVHAGRGGSRDYLYCAGVRHRGTGLSDFGADVSAEPDSDRRIRGAGTPAGGAGLRGTEIAEIGIICWLNTSNPFNLMFESDRKSLYSYKHFEYDG